MRPEAIRDLVDELTETKAKIAALTKVKAELESDLIALGAGRYDGTLTRATVTSCDGRVSVDWRAIAEHFNPSRQLITAHTSVGDPYYQVRLFGRIADERKAA